MWWWKRASSRVKGYLIVLINDFVCTIFLLYSIYIYSSFIYHSWVLEYIHLILFRTKKKRSKCSESLFFYPNWDVLFINFLYYFFFPQYSTDCITAHKSYITTFILFVLFLVECYKKISMQKPKSYILDW